jgi:CBS domain-containing protein
MISVRKLLGDKWNKTMHVLQPDNTVIEALDLMARKNIGAVMIMEDNRLVGLFSERDYARKGILQGRKAKSTPLSEVMIEDIVTVTPDMDIEDCMTLFTDKYVRHLPVVSNGYVHGMLSIGDIVSAIMKEQKNHIKFLEKYITGSY